MKRLFPLIALLLAFPAGAAAQVRTEYAVTIAGTADYNRADADGDASAQHDISFDFETKIPKVTFFDNVAEDSSGALGTAAIRRGHYVIRGESGSITCTDHAILGTTGGGFDATYGQKATTFAVRVVDSVDVEVRCGEPVGPWTLAMGSGAAEVGMGIFDGSFTMPHDMVGEGQMVFPLKGEVTGAECPFNHFNTVMCSLTWNATVTFKRTKMDVEPVPIVPGEEDEDLLVPIVAKAKLSKDLRSATLPVTCSASCSGTLTAAVGGRTLARRAFKASEAATVKLRFDAADRRAIERAGRVKLTLRSKDLRRNVVLRVS
jgi:hypothetical protein